jgi:DNA topoisomerase IA
MTKRRLTVQIREPADAPSRYDGLKAGDRLTLPARAGRVAAMSEAELIAALSAHGIGRPSTLELIVDGLVKHGYVVRQGNGLVVTELGRVVNDYLAANFGGLFDLGFTARFEGQLDAIASGGTDYVPVLAALWAQIQAAPAGANGVTVTAPEPDDEEDDSPA